jgi:hypothetical protein
MHFPPPDPKQKHLIGKAISQWIRTDLQGHKDRKEREYLTKLNQLNVDSFEAQLVVGTYAMDYGHPDTNAIAERLASYAGATSAPQMRLFQKATAEWIKDPNSSFAGIKEAKTIYRLAELENLDSVQLSGKIDHASPDKKEIARELKSTVLLNVPAGEMVLLEDAVQRWIDSSPKFQTLRDGFKRYFTQQLNALVGLDCTHTAWPRIKRVFNMMDYRSKDGHQLEGLTVANGGHIEVKPGQKVLFIEAATEWLSSGDKFKAIKRDMIAGYSAALDALDNTGFWNKLRPHMGDYTSLDPRAIANAAAGDFHVLPGQIVLFEQAITDWLPGKQFSQFKQLIVDAYKSHLQKKDLPGFDIFLSGLTNIPTFEDFVNQLVHWMKTCFPIAKSNEKVLCNQAVDLLKNEMNILIPYLVRYYSSSYEVAHDQRAHSTKYSGTWLDGATINGVSIKPDEIKNIITASLHYLKVQFETLEQDTYAFDWQSLVHIETVRVLVESDVMSFPDDLSLIIVSKVFNKFAADAQFCYDECSKLNLDQVAAAQNMGDATLMTRFGIDPSQVGAMKVALKIAYAEKAEIQAQEELRKKEAQRYKKHVLEELTKILMKLDSSSKSKKTMTDLINAVAKIDLDLQNPIIVKNRIAGFELRKLGLDAQTTQMLEVENEKLMKAIRAEGKSVLIGDFLIRLFRDYAEVQMLAMKANQSTPKTVSPVSVPSAPVEKAGGKKGKEKINPAEEQFKIAPSFLSSSGAQRFPTRKLQEVPPQEPIPRAGQQLQKGRQRKGIRGPETQSTEPKSLRFN